MSTLPAGTALDAPTLRLDPDPAGDGPRTATLGLGTVAGAELGVWELGVGVAHDVEVDEVFVVIAGRAEVHVDGVETPLVLGPGTVGRLAAGMRTVWTVTETLRKVYLLAS